MEIFCGAGGFGLGFGVGFFITGLGLGGAGLGAGFLTTGLGLGGVGLGTQAFAPLVLGEWGGPAELEEGKWRPVQRHV